MNDYYIRTCNLNFKKINSTVNFFKNNYLCKHLTTNVPYILYFKLFNVIQTKISLKKLVCILTAFGELRFVFYFFFNYERDGDTKRHYNGGPDLCAARP